MYSITIQAPTSHKAALAMQETAHLIAAAAQKAEEHGASICIDSWLDNPVVAEGSLSASAPASLASQPVAAGEQPSAAQEPVKAKRQRGADKADHIGAAKQGGDGEETAAGEEPETQPAAVSEEPANENTPQEETPTVSGAVTYDDVKTATNSLAAKKGREAALALLGDFNVAKAQELAEAQWSDYVAQANERLAA